MADLDRERKNPYIGPRAFRPGERIYGRDQETARLVNLLIAERIVLLYSPSGAGKTSLIQAALLPKLTLRKFNVLPVIRVNLDPPENLMSEPGFNRYLFSAIKLLEEKVPDDQRKPDEVLAKTTFSDYLSQRPRPEGVVDADVLIFDQFEELLTLDPTDTKAKADFMVQLGQALEDRRRFALISMREDFAAGLDPYRLPIPTRLETTFRLDLLSQDAARQPIQKPATEKGVEFKEEAVQKLVDNLRLVQVQQPDGSVKMQEGPYVEPVQLQVVCYRLWENLDPQAQQISEKEIETIGDVDRSLAEFYSDRVLSVSEEKKFSERMIREWFEHQLISKSGIRSQVMMEEGKSGGLDNEIIRALESTHLVRSDNRRGTIWFELAHDRLIAPVRKNNEEWFTNCLSLLQRQASLWDRSSRPDHLLLRNSDLKNAESWADAHPQELTKTDCDFLEACQAEYARQEAEREAAEQALKLDAAERLAESEKRRAEEQAKAATSLRKRLIVAVAGIIAAIVFAVAATLSGASAIRTSYTNQTLAAQANDMAEQAKLDAATKGALASTSDFNASEANRQRFLAETAKAVANREAFSARYAKETAEVAQQLAERNAGIAATQANQADQQARIALSRQLAVQAASYLEDKLSLAMLLGIEAYRTAGTFESRSILLSALQRGLSQDTLPASSIPTQEGRVLTVAFNPQDDNEIAWTTSTGQVIVYDLAEKLVKKQVTDISLGRVFSMAYRPDGKMLAYGGEDGKISLWDLQSDEKKKFTAVYTDQRGGTWHLGWVLSLSFSPDGRTLAASGQGSTTILWNVDDQTVKLLLTPPGKSNDVWSTAWKPGGSQIATASADGKVRIWNPTSGDLIKELVGHYGKVYTVAWSRDGRYLASGGEPLPNSTDRTLFIWDTINWTSKFYSGNRGKVLSLAFSNDGKTLATGGTDRAVVLWNYRNGEITGELSSHDHWVESVAFSSKGRNLLASGSVDKTVVVVEFVTRQSISEALFRSPGELRGLVSPGAGVIEAAGGSANSLTLWEINNGSPKTLRNINHANTSLAYSPDGALMALGDAEGDITLYDRSTGKETGKLDGPPGAVTALAFSADGNTIASARCGDTGEQASPDSCARNEVWLWDRQGSKQPVQYYPNHSDIIRSLAISKEGVLASGSQDTTILLWSIPDRQQIGLPLVRHKDSVVALAFDKDGKTLASGSRDGEILLWDMDAQQVIGEPLTGAGGAVTSLAFDAGNQKLYSGSSGGGLLTWLVSPETWVELACTQAGRNMTPAEWKQFLPQEQNQRATCSQYAKTRSK